MAASEIFDRLPHLGYSDAADRVGSTAAPLLAGFAVTLVGLVVSNEQDLRWPDQTLLTLLVAALFLVAAVQFNVRARQFYLPIAEFNDRLKLLDRKFHKRKRDEYARNLRDHGRWLRRAAFAYNVGVSVLLLGLAGILLPPGEISLWRWFAVGTALLGCVLEASWAIASDIKVGAWNRSLAATK